MVLDKANDESTGPQVYRNYCASKAIKTFPRNDLAAKYDVERIKLPSGTHDDAEILLGILEAYQIARKNNNFKKQVSSLIGKRDTSTKEGGVKLMTCNTQKSSTKELQLDMMVTDGEQDTEGVHGTTYAREYKAHLKTAADNTNK